MVDYREILRLQSLGYSQNQIEASAHVSHHTVKEVLAAAQSLGISWPLEEQLTNANPYLSIWLGAVSVWLFLRQGTAESPSSVGSRSGIYRC